MSGRNHDGVPFVTRAELDRLVERLRLRFAAIESRIDGNGGYLDAHERIDALERHVRPFGDGKKPIDLAGWERQVNAKRWRR